MSKVFIIAEAGVNHNGDLDLAKKMVDVAKDCEVDAIKFQTFNSKKVTSRYAPKAEYQEQTTSQEESQLEMLRKLELDENGHQELFNYCQKKNIIYLSSPFDLDSIDLLNNFGLEIFKIPSGEITNLPYLRKLGKLNKKIIMSTGMAKLGEIETAIEIIVKEGTDRDKISVLQCNTEYPTPYSDVNLNAMLSIGQALKLEIGYSDHTNGIEIPIAAAALGAKIIEKHFTLDKKMNGPDHKASLDPIELRAMVKAIRNVEAALGNGIKTPSSSEEKNIVIARKSIVASIVIKKGEIFTEGKLAVKRPGNGISPLLWDEVIGRIAIRDFKEDELIEL